MTSVVLDSSAVLAVIHAEPGADVVIEALDDAIVSAVNHAEVITKLVERGRFSILPGLWFFKSACELSILTSVLRNAPVICGGTPDISDYRLPTALVSRWLGGKTSSL